MEEILMFDLIWALALGALVGWLAGKVMGREGGLVRNIVVGVGETNYSRLIQEAVDELRKGIDRTC